MTDLITRPRRLRQSAALRALFEDNTEFERPGVADLC